MYIAKSLSGDYDWTGCIKPDHGLSVVWPSDAKKQAHELDALIKDFAKIVRDSSASADYKDRWSGWLKNWQRHLQWVDGLIVLHGSDAMDRNDEYNCDLTKWKTELADELVPVKVQPGGGAVAADGTRSGASASGSAAKRSSGSVWPMLLLGAVALGVGVVVSKPRKRA